MDAVKIETAFIDKLEIVVDSRYLLNERSTKVVLFGEEPVPIR